MKRLFRGKRMVILLAAVLLLVVLILFFVFSGQDAGYKRTSEYLTMADGTRLAYDLYLPTIDGVPADGPLPTLFKYTPYNRALTQFDETGHCDFCDFPGAPWYGELMLRGRRAIMGDVSDTVQRTEWVGDVLKSGYAVVVVDRPGTGASFGEASSDPDMIVNELDELLNWIADQTWCDGNIGMFGDSINARIQFHAATTGNPHLKAILPATTWMDTYSGVMFPGGVLNKGFANIYSQINIFIAKMATPVDSDTDGTLLAQARAERAVGSALAKVVPFVKTTK